MKAGLYQPDEFKDNCGFGLIAHMQGEPSHTLLQTAIEALTCMTHRVLEQRMNDAIQALEALQGVVGPVVRIRVEHLN